MCSWCYSHVASILISENKLKYDLKQFVLMALTPVFLSLFGYFEMSDQ